MNIFNRLLSTGKAFLVQEDPKKKLLQIWEEITYLSSNSEIFSLPIEKTPYVRLLSQIIDLLFKEQAISDGGIDSGCTELFLNNDILNNLFLLGESDIPIGFRDEIIAFTSTLISLLDGSILFQKSIISPIQRTIQSALNRKSEATNLLELEYMIAVKIFELPKIISVLYFSRYIVKNSQSPPRSLSKFHRYDSSLTLNENQDDDLATDFINENHDRKIDFPIFEHVLRFIHQEDQYGDYARAILTILLQHITPEIEDYVLSSNFSFSVVGALIIAHSQFVESRDFIIRVVRFIDNILNKTSTKSICSLLLEEISATFFSGILFEQIRSGSDYDGSSRIWLKLVRIFAAHIKNDCFITLLLEFLLKDTHSEKEDVELIRHHFVSKLFSSSRDTSEEAMKSMVSLMINHHLKCVPLLIGNLGMMARTSIRLDPEQSITFLDSMTEWICGTGIISDVSELKVYCDETHSIRSTLTSHLEVLEDEFTNVILLLETDGTLNMLLEKFANYFNHSFEYNNHLLHILSQLCTSPFNVLFYFLVGMNSEIKQDSLLSTLKSHILDIINQQNADPSLARKLEEIRSKPFSSQRNRISIDEDFTPDIQNLRNILLLQEFAKELVSLTYLQCATTWN